MLLVRQRKISLLFFTVPDKQTDPKSSPGLCFPDYLGTFTARLETTSQHDVELMICNSPGNQMVILIEVPGVFLLHRSRLPISKRVPRFTLEFLQP